MFNFTIYIVSNSRNGGVVCVLVCWRVGDVILMAYDDADVEQVWWQKPKSKKLNKIIAALHLHMTLSTFMCMCVCLCVNLNASVAKIELAIFLVKPIINRIEDEPMKPWRCLRCFLYTLHTYIYKCLYR